MAKVILLLGLIGIVYLWWTSRGRPSTRAMPAADARRLLGVSQDATLEDIRAAHRRLIAKVHPDTGGSAELAERVNAARDALVTEMNRGPPRAS